MLAEALAEVAMRVGHAREVGVLWTRADSSDPFVASSGERGHRSFRQAVIRFAERSPLKSDVTRTETRMSLDISLGSRVSSGLLKVTAVLLSLMRTWRGGRASVQVWMYNARIW